MYRENVKIFEPLSGFQDLRISFSFLLRVVLKIKGKVFLSHNNSSY